MYKSRDLWYYFLVSNTSSNMTTRFDKLDWLLDNCTSVFITDFTILRELVAWMNDDSFDEFFNRKCAEWNIDHPFDADEEA